jgi:hypothetical protein
MVYIFSGTRRGAPEFTIRRKLTEIKNGSPIIIHGDAKGVDTQVHTLATKMGFNIIRVPANWDGYGKKAGPIRNRLMIDIALGLVEMYEWEEDAVRLVAFPDKNSVGTQNMIGQARLYKIETEVIDV